MMKSRSSSENIVNGTRLLVMSPQRANWHWLRRVFPGEVLRSRDPAGRCEAVLVLNDHSPQVVTLLAEALALRSDRPALPLVMLTPVPADASGLAAIVRAIGAPGPACPIPERQLTAALALERLPMRTHLGTEAINFEYSV
jgi:hypothetical protein